MSATQGHPAFSQAVKAEQQRRGARAQYERLEAKDNWRREVTDDLAAFLQQTDSFYLATASASAQPYVQHRGGPKGFLKVLGPNRLAFADFAGNRQYVSLGNLAENGKAQIFITHYATQQRIKIWGTARAVEDDQQLLSLLVDPAYGARPERAIVFDILLWESNCRQHIMPRYDQEQVALVVQELTSRIAELERQLAVAKAGTP